jgi:endonuclease YncB( thermonuclease family)
VIRRYRYDSGGRAGFTLFLSLLALVIGVWPQQAEPADSLVEGEVVRIADGDTLTLLTLEKEQVKVRLAEIDTPEKGQPYYQKAKQALADRVFRQNIQVEIVDWDRYGRAVGKIILDGHIQQLVKREYGERWECDCEEYREIRPNTPRAYCRHVEAAMNLALMSPVT